jgi:hypothetical protein
MWSLDILKGWSVVIDSDQTSMRMFYDADVRHGAYQSAVEWKGGDIGFRIVPIPRGETIQSHAEAMMKRHVAQGEPERYSQLVGGRSAYAYSWTDGVNNIDTCFVEATSGVVLRIDISTAMLGGHYSAVAKSVRSAAEQIIGTFAWAGSSS